MSEDDLAFIEVINTALTLKRSSPGKSEPKDGYITCDEFAWAMPDSQGSSSTCVIHSLAKAIVEGYMKKIFNPWIIDFDQACVVSALLQFQRRDSSEKSPVDFNRKDIEQKDNLNNQWNIVLSVEETTFDEFLQDCQSMNPQYTYILGVTKDNAAKHIHHSLQENHCVFVRSYNRFEEFFETINSSGPTAQYPEIPKGRVHLICLGKNLD